MWVLVEYSYVCVFEASVESFIHIYMDSVYVCVSVRACLFGVFVHCEISFAGGRVSELRLIGKGVCTRA